MIGVTFGDKHTWRDWGLKWLGCELPMPEPRTISVEVPGLDGVLDYTQALTNEACLANREIVLTFDRMDADLASWQRVYSQIAAACHGKKLRIILDTDPDYYYYGRVSLSASKESERVSQVVFTVDADPYKYELVSSGEDWLWDSFNFETGVIRYYKELSVSGSRTVTCIGVQRPVIPVFYCSAAMSVSFGGQSYQIYPKIDGSRIPEIVLQPGENTLTFTGDGTVTIDYRGSVL